jgi:hypothetical protein
LPDLIHRRIVSGSRPVCRAASGTVSIVAAYYYKVWTGTRAPCNEATRVRNDPVTLTLYKGR